MKKTLLFSILISVLIASVAPVVLAADTLIPPQKCTIKRTISVGTDASEICGSEEDIGGSKGWCCVLNTLYNITDWIFVVLIVLASLFVAVGAWFFLTSAGNPEGTTKGRLYILYAAIGLAIAFVSKAIPGFVKLIIGAK